MNQNIIVSVVMLTYKHAPYIVQAIKGVLNQNTNFQFELIISNDTSPDETDSIVSEFLENHPKKECVKYCNHPNNIGFVENQIFTFGKCKGKYIAYCEGDDYWTDMNKLQKQVDFLEQNPDYSIVSARCNTYLQNKDILNSDGKDSYFENKSFLDYDKDSFFSFRPMQTFTVMFRAEAFDYLKISNLYKENFRDLPYFYHILEHGKGRSFNEFVGVYRIHDDGVYAGLEGIKQLEQSISLFEDIKKISGNKNADIQLKKDLHFLIVNLIYQSKYPIFQIKIYRNILKIFQLTNSIKKTLHYLWLILKYAFINFFKM